MIIDAIVNFFEGLFTGVLSYIPTVSIQTIPFVGLTFNSILVSMIHGYFGLIGTVPYLQVVFQAFAFVILPFEFVVLTIKIILGSRVPIKE